MEYSLAQGEILFTEGKIEEAEDCFLSLLANDPTDVNVLNNLGVIRHGLGDMRGAEDLFLKVLSENEDYLDAHVNLADLYQDQKRWEEAVFHLERCTVLNTQDPNLFNRLAMVHLEMGDQEKAGKALRKSLLLDPNQEMVKDAFHQLGRPEAGLRTLIIDDSLFRDKHPECTDRPGRSRLPGAGPDDLERFEYILRRVSRVGRFFDDSKAKDTSWQIRLRTCMEEDIMPELGFLFSESGKLPPGSHFAFPTETLDINMDESDITITRAVLSGLKGVFHLLLAKGFYGGGREYKANIIKARRALASGEALFHSWLERIEKEVISLAYFQKYAPADEQEKNFRVLLTDASYKHTLAILRDLSKKGIRVDVLGSSPWSQAFFSKYCNKRIIGPSYEDEPAFIEHLESLLAENDYDLLMPVGYRSFELISKHKEALGRHVPLVLEDHGKIRMCMNKKRVYEIASRIGIPVPTTYYPITLDEIETLSKQISYPVVIKGIFEVGGNIVEYADNPVELVGRYTAVCKRFGLQGGDLPMVQEYIPGRGFGYYGLYDRGECKRSFMHKRIRMYPVKGGASVCAESFYDSELKALGQKLLDHLKWHGIAMVEFRRDERDSRYKLMEVNPKFWGSLDLSLQAGISYPYALCRLAKGENLAYSEEYERNLRLHWPLDGDLSHVLEVPDAIPAFLADLGNPDVKKNILIDDPGPLAFQAGSIIKACLSRCILPELKGIFHIHSKYSFDSILEPSEIIRHAENHGYDIVAITDHHTIRGALEALEHAKDGYPIVIPGAEYATNKGDIIGLFLKEEIGSHDASEVLSSIKAQGGISILPHPFRGHRLDDEILMAVDMIEVFNPRVSREQNEQALDLCKRYEKSPFAGCDAHFLEELNLASITFDTPGSLDVKDLLLNGEKRFSFARANQMYEILSQTVKGAKARSEGVSR